MPVQPAYAEYVPSFYRISTVYPMIAEPPSAGAAQVISTSVVPDIAVTGAAGVLGAETKVHVITWVLVTNRLLANETIAFNEQNCKA